MKQSLYLGAATALAMMVSFAGSANAAVIDGITVTNSGLVSPASPDHTQPTAYASWGAKINFGASNSGQSNNGWDPFDTSASNGDTSHHWWNVGEYGGYAGFNFVGSNLNIVWGSPNDNNTVSFYSGLFGSGALIGQVTNADLIAAFGVGNYHQPGYLIGFTTPESFKSVVFSTGPTAFEFAVATPELSTWGMMLAGFAALGFAGYRRSKVASLES